MRVFRALRMTLLHSSSSTYLRDRPLRNTSTSSRTWSTGSSCRCTATVTRQSLSLR